LEAKPVGPSLEPFQQKIKKGKGELVEIGQKSEVARQ
jgi:hypothetical protein